MEIIGYICAALVGVSLGVLGSGGSILTVPIMVYLMNINPLEATGYSLFVVGITSAVGGAAYVQRKLVNFKMVVVFAIPSVISVFLMRRYLVPAIPEIIILNSKMLISKELLILILFAILMIVVAYNMIRNASYKEPAETELQQYNYTRLIIIGFTSGILTGILGVGGGFIIIPALVLYAGVSVRMSVGTSLLIIAFNSLSGFAEEVLEKHAIMNYYFLLLFTALAVAGIFIGFRLSLNMNAAQLKRLFGWFVLVMGTAIFIKEVFMPFK
jgi:uncharacterized protein